MSKNYGAPLPNLRAAISGTGLTMTAFATDAGVSKSAISRGCSGKNLSPKTWIAIDAALGRNKPLKNIARAS